MHRLLITYRPLLASVLGLFLLIFSGAVKANTMQLLGRSDAVHYSVSLNDKDWEWLKQKGTLRLGISDTDYPPFDITNDGRNYEGITADYMKLISDSLHVKVEIIRFGSRAEAIDSLKNMKVDLLGTTDYFQEYDQELSMSVAYADYQPALVVRGNAHRPLPQNMAGKKIALVYNYLPQDKVQSFYIGAEIKLYSTGLNAISAVAFGEADVYLGDAISANYIISSSYLTNVHIASSPHMDGGKFVFSMRRANTSLQRIINAALAEIPINKRMAILHRWGAMKISMPGQHFLNFTTSEQRWLDETPRVKVAVVNSFLPFSFFDDEGNFHGVSADVLKMITLRTGLQFDIVQCTSPVQMIAQLREGNADMLAAITPSFQREQEMYFTQPYLTTPYVLVSRANTEVPRDLEEMTGKKLALINGNVLHAFFASRYPQIQIVNVDNSAQAISLVAKGKVDGAITSLINANYMISHQYSKKLQVSFTVGEVPARYTFATGLGSPVLHSILEKALLSIPPEEMSELPSRWHNQVFVSSNFWLRNRSVFFQGFGLAALLLLIAIVWIFYLRKLIHHRETAELALINQLEFMRVLINGTPHPIYVRDREGRMLICNTAYLNVFNIKSEEVIGKLVTELDFINIDVSQPYHDEYLQVMVDSDPHLDDRTVTLPDGKTVSIYIWMLPYRDIDGVVIGMIAGWIDISERKTLLCLLEESKKLADNANKAKTTFLATMSHEIRTPMNAVIGMLELALKKAEHGVLDRVALEVASDAAIGLQELIGDVLDIVRIESGKLSLAPERANFRALIESVIRVFKEVARPKNLQLIFSFDSRADGDFLIDTLRVKQIISNLLSNAIKFTNIGEIHITLEVLPSTVDGHLSVRLRVEDSGIGISKEDQCRLFSPFTQAASNKQSARAGSGLGLVISRSLCEMMGGTLRLSSELDKGTTIELLLDLPVLQPIAKTTCSVVDAEVKQHVLNILIVDDYKPNRILLSRQLNYLGHNVVEAEDGAHGLHAWKYHTFDVVITDCNMPVMNGYAFARAVRIEEQKRDLRRCLIIGFTANAQPDEIDNCLSAGMDDCLFKPTTLNCLSECLISALPITGTIAMVHTKPAPDRSFELSHLEQLLGTDDKTFHDFLGDLLQITEDDLVRLTMFLFKNDIQGLSDLAHKVKGGARIITAQGLVSACEILESACQSNFDEERLSLAVDSLNAEMMELATSLRRYMGNKSHGVRIV